MSYTFRIRFNRSPQNTIETDTSELIIAVPNGGISLSLRNPNISQPIRDSNQLVLVGDGYDSAQQATEAGRRFQKALMVALARIRVGADFGQRAAKGAFTEYGLKWIKEQIGHRTLNNVHGLMVYESEPKPRFISTNAVGIRGVNADAFHNALVTSINRQPTLTDREMLSYSLFNASFFQPTADSRFILLVMAVEALIKPTPRSAEACAHVDGLITQTRAVSFSEAEKASMIGALHLLKSESINQAGKRLVANRLGDRLYRDLRAPDFFSHCYKLRSDLVHGNVPFPTFEEIGNVVGNLEVFVSDLLTSSILGQAT